MEWALAVVGIVAVVIWFMRGVFNAHSRRQNDDLQAYYDSLSDNNKADDSLHDPERVQHVQDKFND